MSHRMDKKIRATIYKNQDFLIVIGHSGKVRTVTDYDSFTKYLRIDASYQNVGEAVLEAFEANIYIESMEEFRDFCSFERNGDRFDRWVQKSMQKFGYIDEKQLLENMVLINVEVLNGQIEIAPTKKVGTSSWSGTGIPKCRTLYIDVDSSSEEIGKAVSNSILYSESLFR